ncbi:MAG: prepilin peptidase [Clostridia bacterium]|nr:prepilin peptidase [Clostridia bacterium]
MDNVRYFYLAVFLFPITWCTVTDLADGEIQDAALPLVLLGGLGLAHFLSVGEMFLSLAAGGLFFLIFYRMSRFTGKGIGGGDVKLITLLIICCGIRAAFTVVLIAFAAAGVFALVVSITKFVRRILSADKNNKSRHVPGKYGGGIPFAPFLEAGLIFYYCVLV